MATRIIAVLNQKGGVGKTTTCVNLGAALALRGQQVVLIDIDPQANMSVHLGLDPHHIKATSYSVLLGEHSLPEAMVQTSTPGLRMVPSTLALANAEIQLASAVGRELILTEAIQNWLYPEPDLNPLPFEAGSDVTAPPSDYVLIDCPPSLGILTMNALCAATDVLLPIQTEFFALQGVRGILESLKAVQRLNKSLKLSIVLPSMVDYRTNLAKDVIAEVRKYFGHLVTSTVIRTNVKLAEAPSHGLTIFEYDRSSRGAKDYGALADEVLGIPPADDDAPSRSAKAKPSKKKQKAAESASSNASSSASASARESAQASPSEPAPAEPSPLEPSASQATHGVGSPASAAPPVPTPAPALTAPVPTAPVLPAPIPPAPAPTPPQMAEQVAESRPVPPSPSAPPSAYGPVSAAISDEQADTAASTRDESTESDFARALEVTTAVESAVTHVSLPVPVAEVPAEPVRPGAPHSPPASPVTPAPTTWHRTSATASFSSQNDGQERTSSVDVSPSHQPAPEAPASFVSPSETRIGLPADPVEPVDDVIDPAVFSATLESVSPIPDEPRNRLRDDTSEITPEVATDSETEPPAEKSRREDTTPDPRAFRRGF